MVLTVHLCMYVVRNTDNSDIGCSDVVSTLKMKNFDTHLVFICNTFNYKSKISTKPQNMLTSDFSRLQIYLWPDKVPFATVPNIRLTR